MHDRSVLPTATSDQGARLPSERGHDRDWPLMGPNFKPYSRRYTSKPQRALDVVIIQDQIESLRLVCGNPHHE